MTARSIRCSRCSSDDLTVEAGIPEFGEEIPYFVCRNCEATWPVPFELIDAFPIERSQPQ